jgi:tRNA threonylcarbamoyladenosine biosynthesis protein TsaB
VSVSENGKLLFIKEQQEGLSHSEMLTVFIQQLFTENKLHPTQISAVSVSMGPGSYTGLRIGVSVAKGLCYGLNIPLIAVGSLDALADFTIHNLKTYTKIKSGRNLMFCPMIDARRMEVYTALYNSEGEIIKPVSAEIITNYSFSAYLEKNNILFFGNGAEKCRDHLIHSNAIFEGPVKASARFMQNQANRKYNKKEFEDVAYFEPFYLKDFVASIPKNKIIK